MRIEAYNQVAQLYQSNKTSGAAKTGKMSSMGRDEVQISSVGRDFQVAKQAVAQASDIREDKVADIKAKMQAGTYSVSTDDFADKLLEKFSSIL